MERIWYHKSACVKFYITKSVKIIITSCFQYNDIVIMFSLLLKMFCLHWNKIMFLNKLQQRDISHISFQNRQNTRITLRHKQCYSNYLVLLMESNQDQTMCKIEKSPIMLVAICNWSILCMHIIKTKKIIFD